MRSERKTPHWTDARPDARVLNAEPRSLSVRYGATDTLRSLKSVPGRVVEYVGVAGDKEFLKQKRNHNKPYPNFSRRRLFQSLHLKHGGVKTSTWSMETTPYHQVKRSTHIISVFYLLLLFIIVHLKCQVNCLLMIVHVNFASPSLRFSSSVRTNTRVFYYYVLMYIAVEMSVRACLKIVLHENV